MEYEWQEDAACTGLPESTFDPFTTDKLKIKKTKQVCSECSVQKHCFIFAWLYKDPGIWGGRTEDERNTIASLFGLSRLASFDDLLNTEFPLVESQNSNRPRHRYIAKVELRLSSSSFVLRPPGQFRLRA